MPVGATPALDRLTSVTREVGGAPVAVETYAFNSLGALKTHAGAPVDDQRPRLDGGGLTDSAVPATAGGEPVALDAAGDRPAGAARGYRPNARSFLCRPSRVMPSDLAAAVLLFWCSRSASMSSQRST
jgi:hypothetical protein